MQSGHLNIVKLPKFTHFRLSLFRILESQSGHLFDILKNQLYNPYTYLLFSFFMVSTLQSRHSFQYWHVQNFSLTIRTFIDIFKNCRFALRTPTKSSVLNNLRDIFGENERRKVLVVLKHRCT